MAHPEFWNNREANYRQYIARREEEERLVRQIASMQKNQAFKKGDQVAYRNSSVSSKFDFELFGEVLSLTPTKVKVRLTNQKGQVAIKDVKPECLRILSD